MAKVSTLKAVVHDGKAVIENLDAYPNGTELELAVVDAGDELDEEELAKLDAKLAESLEDEKHGRVRPASEIIAKLRASR